MTKITSWKSFNDLITFYFKINQFEDYWKSDEWNMIQTLNDAPSASILDKNKDLDWYREVSIVFKFETQEIA